MAILYTHNRSSRKKPSVKVLRLREERKVYFSAILKDRPRKERTLNIPERIVKDLPPLSNSVGNGFKRSVEDYKWKRDREESAATVKAIEEKKKRLAPIANKTGYQYITDGADVETLGRKT
jgi:K+/H+ antiporter YhaU regulatory subunit KhtT